MKKVFKNILLSFSLLISMSAETANAYGYDTVSPDQLALAGITRQQWDRLVKNVARQLRILQLQQEMAQLKRRHEALFSDYAKMGKTDDPYYSQQIYEINADYAMRKRELQRLRSLALQEGELL